jgi:hypothetical protein
MMTLGGVVVEVLSGSLRKAKLYVSSFLVTRRSTLLLIGHGERFLFACACGWWFSCEPVVFGDDTCSSFSRSLYYTSMVIFS